MPSPILPDGTLLSLPIPDTDRRVTTTYADISCNGMPYSEIIRQLLPERCGNMLKCERKRVALDTACCHVDPDIAYRYNGHGPDSPGPDAWRPAYGQMSAALKHLENHNVGKGDIFLFYGWFRRTEYAGEGEGRRLRFISPAAGADKTATGADSTATGADSTATGADSTAAAANTAQDKTPDKHVIYGYMEVKEVIHGHGYRQDIHRHEQSSRGNGQDIHGQDFREYWYHPHIMHGLAEGDALFIPEDRLSLDSSLPGYGLLERWTQARQLTMEGHSRRDWRLPDWLKSAEISYHNNTTCGWLPGEKSFRSASRGQEFVIESDDTEAMKEWVLQIIRG